MLTKEEIDKFLALLLAFARATNCSGRNCSELFNVSIKTMARWLSAARGHGGVDRLYISKVEPIEQAINRLNAWDKRHKSYEKIRTILVPSKKIEAIKALLKSA